MDLLLCNKDVTTRRIYSYLASKFDVPDQYAQAILWVIQSQVTNAATLDCDKVSFMLNHIKDTIGYPTWFSVQAMFKAAFVLSIFDNFAVFHYKHLSEMSTNYPEFSSLTIEEQYQLLNYRNYLVVAIKVFDPSVRPTDLLVLIEQILGYTTWEYIAPCKRERRELIFFRVTDVAAKFDVAREPERKPYRPRTKKATKDTPVPAIELTSNQLQGAGAPLIPTNNYTAEVASSALHKRPNESSSYAYYPKRRTGGEFSVNSTEDTQANASCTAAEAAYLHLRTFACNDDEYEDVHIDHAGLADSVNNAELPMGTAHANNNLESVPPPHSTIPDQAKLRHGSAIEEAARNARMKVILRRLVKDTGDTSEAPGRSADVPAEAVSDVATVSSDDAAPFPGDVNSSLNQNDYEIDAPQQTIREERTANCSAKPTLPGVPAAALHNSLAPANVTTTGIAGTSWSAVPRNTFIFSHMNPHASLPVRPPLPHSVLAFGPQSMYAVLNAHLGLQNPNSCTNRTHQPPPPSPAYDIDYPQLSNSLHISNGCSANPYGNNLYNVSHSGGHGGDTSTYTDKRYGSGVLAVAPPTAVSTMPAFAPSTNTRHSDSLSDVWNTQQSEAYNDGSTLYWQQQTRTQSGSNMMLQQDRIIVHQQRQQHDRNMMQQQRQQDQSQKMKMKQ